MFRRLRRHRRNLKLRKALLNDDSQALARALRAGADPNQAFATESRPHAPALLHALQGQQVQCLNLLLEAGAEIPAHAQGTPLGVAAVQASEQPLALLSALLAAGMDANAAQGASFFAALERDDNLALLLINRLMQYGGDIRCCDAQGQTPLALALLDERQMLVGALISSGAPLPDNLAELPCSEALKTFARRKQQDLAIQRQWAHS
ncbi:hypothetical protein [Motiliproteus sp. SC1-56]|uniref:hypothetical protein n=1 Tax=Motiliproteus sp. SC1-56 TaxID=2799565 RepID=UPI001A8D220F|nr:hypothetical protein [Motiliproteus sp. SC1-56]